MNNKGFAISTMLYGLSIIGLLIAVSLLQTISTTRSESQQLVTSIEDDLNTFSATSKFFGGPGITMGNYQIPNYESGWYKIELWGARSGGVPGSYSTATLYLQKKTPLYIYLGTKTSTTTAKTYLCMTSNKGNCTSSNATTRAGSYVMNSNELFNGSSLTGTYPNGNAFTTSQKHFRPETIYLLTNTNNDEFGKARITLISKKYDVNDESKRYHPISNPGASDGTYYIIDKTCGKALTYKEGSFPQVTFENFDGNGNQKWFYNLVDETHSYIINIRKHCALRSGDRDKLFCDNNYRSKDANNNFLITSSIDNSTVYSKISAPSATTSFTVKNTGNHLYLSKINNDAVLNTTYTKLHILNAN